MPTGKARSFVGGSPTHARDGPVRDPTITRNGLPTRASPPFQRRNRWWRRASGARLQADLGGLYVEINQAGGILSPSDPTPYTVPDNGTLPGLTLNKFKLTPPAGGSGIDVSVVTIASAPSNVSVRLGTMKGPFWTHLGDLTVADAAPDFSAVLQAYLAEAAIENGFYVVPLVVHSDTLARFSVSIDVDYLGSVDATPPGLSEVNLPYDVATVPNASSDSLGVSLPAGATIVAGATTARASGAFDETRIVAGYGPTGAVEPVGTIGIAPNMSVAQILTFVEPAVASAVDLLLTPVSQSAQLGLDLRADLDGKPIAHLSSEPL
jgi:hypothetical protein